MKVSLLLCWLVVAGFLTSITPRSFAQSGTGPDVSGPQLKILTPTNGQVFGAPADIPIVVSVSDTNSFVHEFQFYNGTNLIATLILDPLAGMSNSPTLSYTWSDVPAGNYTLTVVGTDTRGVTGTSAPVNITVGPGIPVVTIVATDPTASPGNPGLFTVSRAGSTNNPITVFYSIGGTASNGVDYVTLPNTVMIPAGATSAQITVTPIVDPQPDFAETVVLTLTGSPGASPTTYIVGNPGSAVVTILGNTNAPPEVGIILPTNGTSFTAPASVLILAEAHDSDGFVRTVEFFAGTNSLGIVTNSPIAVDPLFATVPGPTVYPIYPFHLLWTNVPAGDYVLTAVATDNGGATATSGPVNISVTTNLLPPPTNLPPVVKIETPTNGQSFYAFANVEICASAFDLDGFVTTVQFYDGTNSIGIVTNYPIALADTPGAGLPPIHLLCITWSNVPPGGYVLTAVATDNGGAMSTSLPVNINVTTNTPPPPTNIPPVVAIVTPADGTTFAAPANIEIFAGAQDPDGFVRTVEFFENGSSLGTVTNNPVPVEPEAAPASNGNIIYPINPFHFVWTNVPVGDYVLTAVATDNGGASSTSAPVNVFVVTPSNVPPVVTIYATDPIAVEGTNFCCYPLSAAFANYCTGTNTATFLVRRTGGDTNSDLTVDYAIGGTASNGVDYVALPGYVVIPAGKTFALITIIPLDDVDPVPRRFYTVILSLVAPPVAMASPPPYSIGWPGKAEAIILEDHDLPGPPTGLLPDTTFHFCASATNGMNYCLQVSTDLLDWTPVCTNMVVKGCIHFADPETGSFANRYYRVVRAAGLPPY